MRVLVPVPPATRPWLAGLVFVDLSLNPRAVRPLSWYRTPPLNVFAGYGLSVLGRASPLHQVCLLHCEPAPHPPTNASSCCHLIGDRRAAPHNQGFTARLVWCSGSDPRSWDTNGTWPENRGFEPGRVSLLSHERAARIPRPHRSVTPTASDNPGRGGFHRVRTVWSTVRAQLFAMLDGNQATNHRDRLVFITWSLYAFFSSRRTTGVSIDRFSQPSSNAARRYVYGIALDDVCLAAPRHSRRVAWPHPPCRGRSPADGTVRSDLLPAGGWRT